LITVTAGVIKCVVSGDARRAVLEPGGGAGGATLNLMDDDVSNCGTAWPAGNLEVAGGGRLPTVTGWQIGSAGDGGGAKQEGRASKECMPGMKHGRNDSFPAAIEMGVSWEAAASWR
jgi:hypothetical protein